MTDEEYLEMLRLITLEPDPEEESNTDTDDREESAK